MARRGGARSGWNGRARKRAACRKRHWDLCHIYGRGGNDGGGSRIKLCAQPTSPATPSCSAPSPLVRLPGYLYLKTGIGHIAESQASISTQYAWVLWRVCHTARCADNKGISRESPLNKKREKWSPIFFKNVEVAVLPEVDRAVAAGCDEHVAILWRGGVARGVCV